MEMFQNVHTPLSDKERRITEFENYIKSLRIENIFLPTINSENCHYLHFVVYLDNDSNIDQLPASVYPTGSNLTDQIEGWNKDPFSIGLAKIQLADETISIARAFPPGKLRSEVLIGFPSSKPKKSP